MSSSSGNSNNSSSGEGSYCYIAGYDAGSDSTFDVETGKDTTTEAINAAYC
mgnify:CR=1 FL=1|jgi:hypothetical protein